MRVGVNGRTFTTDEPGGAVRVAVRLTRELSRRDVDVVLFGHDSLASQFPDVPVVSRGYRHDSQPFGVVWERTVLPRLARESGVDVLFCPNGNGPLFDPGVPVVVQVHDVNALEGYSSRLHRTYRRLTVPRAARVADALVTVSEFSKRELVSLLDVSPKDVHVVYNGVDEAFHEPVDLTALDCPDSFVLSVGAMNPRKNVERLVEAHRRLLATTDLPHELLLVGPDHAMIFDDLSVPTDDAVLTPGYLTREELKCAYARADAFVYPSLYEGFGLPPLEAMACGTPVVAGDATALPEVLGDAAAFVDPHDVGDIADGMRRVLDDAAFAEELVRRGRERVRRYTWERAGDSLLNVLEGVA